MPHDPKRPSRPREKTRWPGVFKRGSRYQVRVVVNGKKISRSAATAKEAIALRDELRVARARGTFVATERLTLAAFAEEWLGGYRGRSRTGVREATVEEYRRDLDLHILPALGAHLLTAIRTSHVDRLARELATGTAPSPPGFTRRRLGPGSVQRVVAPLRAMLGDAVRQGIIAVNPCRDLRLPGPNLADREIVVLAPEQTAALIGAAPPGWPAVLLRLLAQTGLRISEAAALAWNDVNLRAARPLLHVRRAVVKGRLDAPKSRHGVRSVPLTRELAAALAELRASREVAQLGRRDLIFGDLRGRPRDYRALRRASLDPAAQEAGIEIGGFHTLRHTCATDLLRAGVPVVVVSRMLGHHSAAFTLSTYGHMVSSDLADVDAVFGRGRA